jgi:diadenosine tetraphosphate (Ap4A) HIT family hydrolase
LRDLLEKTGRRLTSDPIRTSLGLLPSGPDPVGEWLVHRQSPGHYLGPKAPESKPDGSGFAGLVRQHGKALVAAMPSEAPAWSLHSQLKKDTIDIGDLPLCRVLVIKDAHYPWLLLVPRRDGAVEIIDLDEVEQAQLMTEISRTARALKEITRCDKLNIAALGNVVPQLHVHVIARRSSDAAWPRPVWGVMPPLAHDAEEVQNFISALRRKIWLG